MCNALNQCNDEQPDDEVKVLLHLQAVLLKNICGSLSSLWTDAQAGPYIVAFAK